MAPPRVTATNDRTKPVWKKRARSHESVKSSKAITTTATNSATRYCGIRNGRMWRMPPRNVQAP